LNLDYLKLEKTLTRDRYRPIKSPQKPFEKTGGRGGEDATAKGRERRAEQKEKKKMDMLRYKVHLPYL